MPPGLTSLGCARWKRGSETDLAAASLFGKETKAETGAAGHRGLKPGTHDWVLTPVLSPSRGFIVESTKWQVSRQ